MERALDPSLLNEALGSPSSLPSAEELGRLLAQAEISLFIRQPQLPDDLLVTAWYLHGIASADEAAELYSEERRRAAWRVSAHIFDIALEFDPPDVSTRLRHCFAAQVGYLRSGLSPNAMAVHRRTMAATETPNVFDVDDSCMLMACHLLRMDWGLLRRHLQQVAAQLGELAAADEAADLRQTALGPVVAVRDGCSELMRFLMYGDSQALQRADSRLADAVVPSPAAASFVDARWVAAHLRTLGQELPSSSVWTALPPTIPDGVRRALTLGQPAVSVLWPPQLAAIQAVNGVSALDPGVRRVVLSVPTSSGKTLVSQLFTLTHLAMGTGGVCYVVPTRSLAREVRRDLRGRLRLLGRTVASDVSEWSPTGDIADEVHVMTPERLVHLVRTEPHELLNRFGLFVFDEAHSVGEGERGFTLEYAIALLHALTANTSHRTMLMSAALGNQAQVRTWVDPDAEGRAAFSDWRGPRRLHAVFNTDIDWRQTPVEADVSSRIWPKRAEYNVHGRIRLRPTATGTVSELVTQGPIGKRVFRVDPTGQRETDPSTGRLKAHDSSTPNYVMLVGLIRLVAESGPVLIIRSTRSETRQLAQELARELPPQPEAAITADFVASRLGDAHPLSVVLRSGIAYHHSGLPVDVLDAIEQGVRQGSIRYIVATTGIADGVNLPVRTVLIVESPGYSGAVPLSAAQMLNAVGRAGRSCIESEGWAILVRYAAPAATDFARLDPEASELHVVSRLAEDHALTALAEFESLRATTADALFRVADPTVSNFVSFVWLVLATNEELGTLHERDSLERTIQATLAWTQLTDSQRLRWLALARTVEVEYLATPPLRRRRWGRVATSIGTARTLDLLAQELAQRARETERDDLPTVAGTFRLLHTHDFFSRLMTVPEAGEIKRIYSSRGGRNRREVAVDHAAMLADWLSGADIKQLADRHLAAIDDVAWRYEQLGDYLTGRFETLLSWLVGTLVDWANTLLDIDALDDRRLCPDFGAHVKFGTYQPLALLLLQRGLTSRTLANEIAAHAARQGWESLEQVQEGLRQMGASSWRTTFTPSTNDLRELVEFTRDTSTRLLGRLLAGESVQLPVAVRAGVAPGPVLIHWEEEPALFGLMELWRDSVRVGEVPSQYHSELTTLLDLQLNPTSALVQSAEGLVLALQIDLT